MIRHLDTGGFLNEAAGYPVVDVRSPGEFAQGHIPGARNVPLFDDAERAAVGTRYACAGKQDAMQKGLEIALPKREWFIEQAGNISDRGTLLVHCWRGGLRSAAMADLFHDAGYEIALLNGGYKAYRRYIREEFARPAGIIVLGGFTGSGKTELLRAIAAGGEQVIDLEGLACHKGSAFGGLGQPEQPTNEQFENNLYAQWARMDFSRRIWMEDESRMIGRVTLPDPVITQLGSGILIRIIREDRFRIIRLVEEYSGFDRYLLEEGIRKIAEQLGGARTKLAITALEEGRFDEVAAIVLSYYDKAYLYSMSRRKGSRVSDIFLPGGDPRVEANKVIDFINDLSPAPPLQGEG